MTNAELKEIIAEQVDNDQEILNDIMIFDSEAFADAAIGLSTNHQIIYDYDKMIEGLMTKDGMTYEEAVEWIEYNTIRTMSYMNNPPVILHTFVS